MKQVKITKAKSLLFALFLFSSFSLFSNDTPLNCNEDEQCCLSVEAPDDLFDITNEKSISALIDRMSAVLSPIIADLVNIYNEVQPELNEIIVSFGDILKVENLCHPNELHNSQVVVKNFASKVEACETQFKNKLKLSHAKLTKDYKDEAAFCMSLKLGLDTFGKLFLEYFEVEKEAAMKINNILTFCSSIQGEFWESENTLFFKNEADEDTYSNLIQDLLDHIEKESTVVKRLPNSSI